MFNTEEIYFDVAGELLRRRGKTFTTELHHAMMGRPARDGIRTMIEWNDLTDSYETLHDESAVIFEEMLADRLAPMPGVLDLLDALEAHSIPKAVATSSGRAYVQRVLGQFNLVERFRFLLCAEDVVHGKPNPEIYLKAASGLGIDARDVLVLEDSQNGFKAAHASGAVAVAVPGAHNDGHVYPGAALVLDTLRDPRLYQLLGIKLGVA